MASYPTSISWDNGFELVPSDGITSDVADDGTIRGLVNFADTVYVGQLVYSYIDSTDRNTLQTFYDTNKALSFSFAYDGDTYTMRYIRHPRKRRMVGGWWRMTVDIHGTKD